MFGDGEDDDDDDEDDGDDDDNGVNSFTSKSTPNRGWGWARNQPPNFAGTW